MDEKINHRLPAIVSSISVQKKNKQRYSIFADEEYLIGVAEQTLLDFNLAKGVEITPVIFRNLQRAEGRFAIKNYFLKLLSNRDHSRGELLNKGSKKDYPKEHIENVLDELESKGFINDAEFAQKFTADKFKLRSWGPVKIKVHLLKKGINKDAARQSIRQVFDKADLRKTFLNLILKKKRQFLREENTLKRKRKIIDHLARKGYHTSDVYNHIDELMRAVKQ